MFGPDDFEVQIQQENPPGIHAEPSIPPAQDEEYGDFIIKHGQNMGGKFLPVNELFGILYIPLNEIGPLEINSYKMCIRDRKSHLICAIALKYLFLTGEMGVCIFKQSICLGIVSGLHNVHATSKPNIRLQ